MTRTLLQKLKSTKLWCAIAGIATGIYIALGGDADNVQIVAGALTSLVSLVTYIITEGKIDAESVKNTVVAVEAAKEAVNENGSK